METAATTEQKLGLREELVDANEQRVAELDQKIAELEAEIRNLPVAEDEADRADKEAYSAAHQEWLANGSKPNARPVFEQPNLKAVHARMKELPKELTFARLARAEAVANLELALSAKAEEEASADRESLARIGSEIAQLDAEREEIQRRVWDAEAKIKQHEIAMYKAQAEANQIRTNLP